jgi:hypothetical protein
VTGMERRRVLADLRAAAFTTDAALAVEVRDNIDAIYKHAGNPMPPGVAAQYAQLTATIQRTKETP